MMEPAMIRRLLALQLALGISVALIVYYALTEPDRRPARRRQERLRRDVEEIEALDSLVGENGNRR